MSTPIGITLTADDQQLLAVLRNMEGHLDRMANSASASFNRAGVAAGRAGAQVQGFGQQTEISARQMSAALRNVPAQFTDIITSLQGGQAPLTVLLQQGGQLKDMFGGILPAFRALGGYMLSLVSPLTLVGGAVAVLGGAFLAGRAEFEATARQLILTGGAAGVTAGQMQGLAASIDSISGATQGRAIEVLNQMAAAGIRGSTSLRQFTLTAIELERAGGPAVEETAKAFAALGKDPVQASQELNKTTNFLTLAVFEQIKALQEQGKTSEAAALAQSAYAREMDKRIPALESQLGLLQRAWRGVTGAASEAWDAILGVGRPETTGEKVAKLTKELEAARKREPLVAGSATAAGPRRSEAAVQADVSAESRRLVIEQEIADAQAAKNERTQAAIQARQALSAFDDRALTSAQKLSRELETYRRQVQAVRADGGVVDEDQIKRVEAAIVESHTKTTAAQRKYGQELENTSELILRLSGFTRQYASEAALIDAAAARGQISRERALQLQKELLALQPGIKAAADAEREAIEARNKALQAAENEVDAYMAAQLRSQGQTAEAAEKALEAAKEEFANYGRLKSEITRTTLLRLQDKLASEEAGTAAYASIYRQIEAHKQLVEVLRQTEDRDTAAKAAKEAAEEWKRAADDIERSLTDALMRGFEGGRGFLDSLKQTIVNTFKTMVLKPIVQPVASGISLGVTNAIGSIFGTTTQAAVGTSGQSGPMSAVGSAIGSSLGSVLAPVVAGFGSITGSAAAYGAAIGTTSIGAGSQAAMLAAQTGGFGTAGLAATSSAAAGAGSGASAMLAAAGPYVAAALALYALYSAVKHKPTPHMGSVVGIAQDGAASTLYGDNSRILDNFNKETDQALKGLGGLSTGILNEVSKAFGGEGGFSAVLKFAADGKDASIGSLGISQNGETVNQFGITSDYNKYSADREQAMQAYTLDVAKATREALTKIQLPEWARKQFDALGSNATIEQLTELANSVASVQKALKSVTEGFNSLGGVFSRVANLTGESLLQLAEFAGGIDNLRAQAASFVENYYQRDEIAGIKAREIQQALAAVGIEKDISTREQFRAVVEGVDVSTEQGRQQLATLLAAQGSFADIAAYIEEMGGTLASVAGQAPEMGVIGGVLSAPEQAQIEAINGVTTAVESVREAIVDLGNAMASPSNSGGGMSYGGGYRGNQTWETTVEP